MSENKPVKIKISFAPGCFDNFEGTQEELDEFVDAIKKLAESGELIENAVRVEDFDEYLDAEEFEEDYQPSRRLH